MQRSFLASLCCPLCQESLALVEETELQADKVIEGSLQCSRCGAQYPINKGIPNLIPGSGWGQSKETEMKGWVNLWQKKGMYDYPAPPDDSFRLPYLDGPWTTTARMFDMALQELNLQGTETVLDFGAGQGWAARHFAERGCQAVAMDIVADDWWGLGRSWAIMEHAGVHFEPVLADGENLPFPPHQFDVVFLAATLHHFNTLGRVLSQIHHALKPQGRLIAIAEPAIPILAREKEAVQTLEEAKEGIIERRPKLFQYWLALKRAGFGPIEIDTFETYRATPAHLFSWIKQLRQADYQAADPPQNWLLWLAYSLVMKLPFKWAVLPALSLQEGALFIRATRRP